MGGSTDGRVLITGGAGFIGSRLARRLRDEGRDVVVLDSMSPQVHGDVPADEMAALHELRTVADVIVGSVTSDSDLRQALRGVSEIVHLAAETGTGQSMYQIDKYVSVNVGGTAKILDLLTREPHGVKRIVVASSRSIYGEGSYRTEDGRTVHPPHRAETDLEVGDFDVHMPGEGRIEVIPTAEDARLHPSSVYGITKQMQESLVMTVAPTLGIEPVSLRYQNVYGPGQSLQNPYTGILSIFSTRIRQGREIRIFEDGLESRDFVYIDDVVAATARAVSHPDAAGEVFNVGSGVPTTVLEVVEALFDAYGARVHAKVTGEFRLGDIRHNMADTRRIREVMDFEARVTFREGVQRFAQWVMNEPIGRDELERSLHEMTQRNLLKTSRAEKR
ncbi:NAD-dependent epimerase/dehydratase family protein [Microbacterium invictum]|uniref:NAD-dependent epimerase/dehydratase family protein n=1 Tax=Microbacterium invictum TaxID=515415 RepID=A0ABZ0V8D0_9MICO|nr:NAD-dependent epimerase/dehydratase family protein [Microbacterium invictum]WQB69489.1 NAD-dependent epimerase/dehydratase family protein [Microbacterium invictum]